MSGQVGILGLGQTPNLAREKQQLTACKGSFITHSMPCEVADCSSVGHGLILTGSLAPLPIVDGGSLLKWTLVERGRTPAEAD